MVVRGKPAARRTATRKAASTRASTATRKAATTTRKPAAKRPTKAAPDVTQYAEKEPTGYHKAFARWIVKEVGYDPNEANSQRAAFLMGVSIATAARPAFQNSEFLEEWRAATGETKRGPKPKAAETKRRAQREVVSDDEFEDEGDEFDEEEEVESEDEDFDEESDSDEDEDFDEDEEESDEDEDEFEDEDEEEEPEPPKRRGRPAAKAPARRTATKKPAARKPATRSKAAASDEEDLF